MNPERLGISRRHIELQLLPRFLYPIKIDQSSEDIISSVREKLKQTPKNVIIYFNHIAYGDPLFAAYIAKQITPTHSHLLICPASYSHTDPDNPKNSTFSQMVKEAERCGVEIHRVIQHYQVDNPEFGYTKNQATEQNMKFMHRLKQLHQTAQPTICLISPEGHRSETGSLHETERGIEVIGNILSPVLYLPVGIIYPHGYDRNSINFGKTTSLIVGSPIQVNRRSENVTVQHLMEHLALCLPTSMRGFYA